MAWTFIKTTLLIGILTGILFVIAYLLGLSPILALGFAGFMNLIIYSSATVLFSGWAVQNVSRKMKPLAFTRL